MYEKKNSFGGDGSLPEDDRLVQLVLLFCDVLFLPHSN